jgi:hypothetical protein
LLFGELRDDRLQLPILAGLQALAVFPIGSEDPRVPPASVRES